MNTSTKYKKQIEPIVQKTSFQTFSVIKLSLIFWMIKILQCASKKSTLQFQRKPQKKSSKSCNF